ncbi:hypothetical protein EVJ58_g6744 [Rhodofomes roseus]|uniref:Uncharacterized protein n=1 Tax=Rhodofomes roseus TaxID=34475 RepID=A0A4Y9Y6S7_9APHY|nr:hypothetical protein EVJ58_g6744 [Rhodofomes roseus]
MSTPKSSFESLISTTSIADDAHLHAALSKYFYPIFDTLPAKCSRSITAALQSTEKEYQLIRGLVAEVDLEGRKRMFETDIEAAEASQDLAVWTATEKKWATAVGDWLVALWQLGVEKGCERPLIDNNAIEFSILHWSKCKTQKLPELRALFFAPEIQTFKASPDYPSFDSLVGRLPSLKDNLLHVTRKRVCDNARSRVLRIQWDAAAAIYSKWGTSMDCLDLATAMEGLPVEGNVLDARLALFTRFCTLRLSSRGTAVCMMQKILQYVLKRCWIRVAQAYPGWDDAWDWLDEAVSDGRLAAQALTLPADATDRQRTQRNEQLAHFKALLVSMAASNEDEKPAVSLVGQKHDRDGETKAQGWGVACDVQRCLKKVASSGTRDDVGVEALAKSALGNQYLASADGVFDVLHDSTSDLSVRTALYALRDVLWGQWDVKRDYATGSGDACPVGRPAKKVRESRRGAPKPTIES